MTGVPNFRDLGGIPTTDGRRIAPGRIFRSETLHQAQVGDWERIAQLGIRLVCDLRSPGERTSEPFPWQGDQPRIAALGLLPDGRTTGREVMGRLVADPSGLAAGALLAENYSLMPVSFEAGLRHLVESVVDRRELPILISCREGKDRTGFVCSLLLVAVGVGRDEVVAEYLRSDAHYDHDVVARAIRAHLGLVDEATPSRAVLDALRVNAGYLERAFLAMDERYGSVDAYLEQAGGLDERRREQLRELVLEP